MPAGCGGSKRSRQLGKAADKAFFYSDFVVEEVVG